MKVQFVGRISALTLFCCSFLAAQNGRTISGTVASPEGLGLRGVSVTVSRLPKDGPPQIYSSATDNQGRFDVRVPEPGIYTICLQPRAGSYLDSCTWQARQDVDVTAGSSSSKFLLERGASLAIWVRDPRGVLAKVQAGGAQPTFTISDAKGVLRQPLRPSKEGDGVLRYSAVVPFSQDFTVALEANGLRLMSTRGEILSASSKRPVASRQLQEIIVDDLTLVP